MLLTYRWIFLDRCGFTSANSWKKLLDMNLRTPELQHHQRSSSLPDQRGALISGSSASTRYQGYVLMAAGVWS